MANNIKKGAVIRFIASIGLVIGCALPTAFAAEPAKPVVTKKIINIQHWQTQQGVPVYFVQASELPMMDLRVIFTAGSAYDDDKQWGVAALTANLLNEGTAHRSADQIADDFDQVGAQFSTSTNRDMSIVGLRSLTEEKYLSPALDTYIDVLTQANFPESVLSRVKQQTLAEIKEQEQDPGVVASRAFFTTLYSGEPYGHPIQGTLTSIAPMDRAQVQAFYQHYYVANNAIIVLAGDLSRQQASKIANRIASSLKPGHPAAQLAASSLHQQALQKHLAFPSEQTTIMMGQVGMNYKNPDYFPLLLGNHILGGLPLDSILFQEVRNKRALAYDASSYFIPLQYLGPFTIVLKTRSDKTKESLKITQQALQQFVTEGPTALQLRKAQENIINAFPNKLLTNKDIASALTQIAFYQLPLDYLDNYQAKIKAVTVQQVKTAFHQNIYPDKFTTITVGPE